MTEDSIIQKLRRHAPLIGDDCAVITAPGEVDLLLTTDFSIEGVHFTRKSSGGQIGYRAVARAMSDIAAMGGTPRYCLVSIALAPWTSESWIDAFYKGIRKMLNQAGASLAGGDISHANQFVCDVMICGTVARGQALLRSGARSGDWIYVSGPLGGWRHRRTVVPRLATGRKLVGKASACMDISDGLALDLHRLCEASSVAAALDNIPLLKGATIGGALHDGEDYELLYTAPPEVRVPGIRIGRIIQGQPGAVSLNGRRVPQIGYDHLQRRIGSARAAESPMKIRH